MDVRLLVGVRGGTRVETHMAEPVHYHTVHQVDSLSGPRQVHLRPVVLRWRGVGVAGGRGGGHAGIPAHRWKMLRNYKIKDYKN